MELFLKQTPVEINLIREEIKEKAVPYYGMLPNGETGYIKLTQFTENCSGEVKEALLDLKSKGCKNIVLCTPPTKEGAIHPAII